LRARESNGYPATCAERLARPNICCRTCGTAWHSAVPAFWYLRPCLRRGCTGSIDPPTATILDWPDPEPRPAA
jgi:hypothetical protein